MAARHAPGSAGVDALLAALDHPLKPAIEEARRALVGNDPLISEQVKWNSLSLCHRGDDRVTFNVRPGGPLLFVFHRGARVKDGSDFRFDDPSGLMTWPAPDRALVKVASLAQWDADKRAILDLVPRWMAAAAAAA